MLHCLSNLLFFISSRSRLKGTFDQYVKLDDWIVAVEKARGVGCAC